MFSLEKKGGIWFRISEVEANTCLFLFLCSVCFCANRNKRYCLLKR